LLIHALFCWLVGLWAIFFNELTYCLVLDSTKSLMHEIDLFWRILKAGNKWGTEVAREMQGSGHSIFLALFQGNGGDVLIFQNRIENRSIEFLKFN